MNRDWSRQGQKAQSPAKGKRPVRQRTRIQTQSCSTRRLLSDRLVWHQKPGRELALVLSSMSWRFQGRLPGGGGLPSTKLGDDTEGICMYKKKVFASLYMCEQACEWAGVRVHMHISGLTCENCSIFAFTVCMCLCASVSVSRAHTHTHTHTVLHT